MKNLRVMFIAWILMSFFISIISCNNDEVYAELVQDSVIEEEVVEEEIVEETPTPEPDPEPEPEPQPIPDGEMSTELKAFPSAYGAGANATGGRGGKVVHVTNLNDSGNGSLRAALTATGARIIVFDVSGVINLNSSIGVQSNSSDVTIAGQSAPDGGITIAGYQVYFENGFSNGIIRYIRFRGGSNGKDCVSTFGVNNVIFDHCSFSFGTDEAFSNTSDTGNRPTTNVTIQRCFMANSKTGMIIGGMNDNYAGGGNISVINNLWYNINHRFPNISGNGNYDVINNIAFNVQNRTIRGNGSFNLLQIGNYYDYQSNAINDTKVNLYSYESSNLPTIYTTGNKIVGNRYGSPLSASKEQMNANNKLAWKYFLETSTKFGNKVRGSQLEDDYFTDNQRNLLGVSFPILSADEAFANVTANVGANSRVTVNGTVVDNTDVLDASWLSNIKNNINASKLTIDQYIVPSIKGGSAYVDSDNDGMPDTWEVAKGLNPNVDDSSADADGDGYTNIEEFLNMVD